MKLLLVSKVISGFVIGFTVAVIAHSIFNIGILSVVFILVSTTFGFLKLVWFYRFKGLLYTNLVFISLFLILKLYISIASN